MFLAWKEIKFSKTRFALIIGIVLLVSYLVSFLTGLAYGLSQEYRMAIDKWDADTIVLTSESNQNLNMSMIDPSEQKNISADETARIGVSSSIVRPEGTESNDMNIDVSLFGIDPNEFLTPNVIEGELFSSENEVVADITLKEEEGVEIGDVLQLSGQDRTVEVSGFTDNARFSVAPVLYADLDTYQHIRFDSNENSGDFPVNAIVIRDSQSAEGLNINNKELEAYPINDFISSLPGYNAQVLTFGLMIGFLVVIAALVVGIFIYVLTLQKTSMLGVMKAQGISTNYIAKSVLAQTFLLAVIGVMVGFGLTILTGVFLPAAVPYQNNYLFLIATSAALIIFALLGAVFSVRTVAKIDPLEAIE
ncbi:ABC transporter permease [Marinilactibacillus psychrotolerans]|uniref:Putative hemin transport system permease protein HrtB n=1 Tax=Marinilactibacillus psychrotolerans TaxID=191770 RepID=A0AAV3WYJ6_9LACT|nr:ABC transporter permease [Marinilactibacillus psychrotolerans]GEL68083.1 ABC transporter permease [Marinilactibacillus psychrotolerans]GEQ36819.1 antimicrobial peptide ABC transporter permease protein [Marinilactibacillus psychrotolerans]SDD35511.1 putative ABC transport system permease protein [Marinilactibacillus psychrotolerans]